MKDLENDGCTIRESLSKVDRNNAPQSRRECTSIQGKPEESERSLGARSTGFLDSSGNRSGRRETTDM